ncbi:MAG: hypothetical protein K2J16_05895, partial [Clostridia bacterium]|nr:hypothetical protein [Clostridia bacterium]
KYTPPKSGLYNVETGGLQFKVYDDSYRLIEKAGNNAVFLRKADNKEYFIVLQNNKSPNLTITNFKVEEMNLERISVDAYNENSPKSVGGKAGDVQFYLLDIKDEGKYIMWLAGVNGNKEIKCNILDVQTFGGGILQSLIVGGETCGYECSFSENQYFLILEYNEDKQAQLYFVH